MLPAPASIAAAPSPKSRASWNPAVPPPPVAGAAAGNGLGDGLRVADGDADGLAGRLAEDLADGLRVGLAEGLALALDVATPGVPLAEAVGVADALVEGEDGGSAAEDGDVVQAETAAQVSMVAMPQPTAVNVALSPFPAMVVRTFTKPPHASGRWRPRFPVPRQEPASEGETHGRPGRCPRRLKTEPRKRRGP
jgi:hypothetical protein